MYLQIDVVTQWKNKFILLQTGTDSKIESMYFWGSEIVWIPVLIQLSFELCPPRVEVQQYLQETCFVSLWTGEQRILQDPHKNLIAPWDVQIPDV